MHPPVEESILQNNPQFAALYNTLTSTVLNPNCSTKNDPARKEREAVKEVPLRRILLAGPLSNANATQELRKHRLRAIKRHLLISAIATANPSESTPKPSLRRPRGLPQPPPSAGPSLPPDLLDLLVLLPPFLSTPSHHLSPESTSLLLSSPPFTSLPSLLPSLSPSISSALVSNATSLARLLNQNTNPSFIHRTIPTLPTSTTSLLTSVASEKHSLSRLRTETTTALTRLLALHARALDLLIRALESKHGNLSRNLELRAAEIALSATKQEHSATSLLSAAKREVYSPQAASALRKYAAHLRDAKGRVREDIAGLAEELGRYGVRVRDEDGDEGRGGKGDDGRERTLREMARVYRDMGRQIEEVRGDLGRLGRA